MLKKISREAVVVSLDGTLRVIARHVEVVDFVPHPSNQNTHSEPEPKDFPLGVLSIGMSGKNEVPWMKFELKMVFGDDDDDDDDENSALKIQKQQPSKKDSSARAHRPVSPQKQQKAMQTPRKMVDRDRDTSNVWYQKQTRDGPCEKRRHEPCLFGSRRRQRRRLLLKEFSEESSEDEEDNGSVGKASLRTAGPGKGKGKASPARRKLEFAEDVINSDTDHSSSSPHSQSDLPQKAVRTAATNDLPPNQSTPGPKVSKSLVTPEAECTATPLKHGKEGSSALPDGSESDRPFSQRENSKKATIKILSMPDDRSQSDEDESWVPQSAGVDEVATQLPKPHSIGNDAQNAGDLTLAQWKCIESMHSEKSFRSCIARLVLARNRKGGLWLPPLLGANGSVRTNGKQLKMRRRPNYE
mmetsp:Transcript_26242/g.72415  ORF Transcript_26242/g.72415 Transcript_26242/m.72415 type:complete len:413 (-) Transcript_26242:7168-8406(-)